MTRPAGTVALNCDVTTPTANRAAASAADPPATTGGPQMLIDIFYHLRALKLPQLNKDVTKVRNKDKGLEI